MQSFIAWVLEHLAKGKHPSSRLNGDPWSAEDRCSPLAGSSMKLKAVCIVVKDDWADIGNTFSFYDHAHHQHPCFLCHARAGTESNWNVFAGCSVLSLPWAAKTQAVYELDCTNAEVLVDIASDEELQVLLESLYFDKRKKGVRGRAVSSDLDQFSLKKGDRLEPRPPYWDICAIDAWSQFPLRLFFGEAASRVW